MDVSEAVPALALALLAVGCTAVVDVDRYRVSGLDGGPLDAGTIRPDGGFDAGPDTCGPCLGGTPYCAEVRSGTYECVACTTDDQCADGVCQGFECRQCREHADCADPTAAQCSALGECVPCGQAGHCGSRLDGRSICDTARVPATCVACTSSAECGDRSCNLLTGQCVEDPRASRTSCEPCTNDDQCAPVGASTSRCIPLDFEGSPHGYYCLPEGSRGCDGPFAVALHRTSLNGAPLTSYCGINEAATTCDAVRALIEDRRCPGGDDDCPTGGFCRALAGGAATDRCTYTCSAASQCLDGATGPNGSTCGTGSVGGPSFCGG